MSEQVSLANGASGEVKKLQAQLNELRSSEKLLRDSNAVTARNVLALQSGLEKLGAKPTLEAVPAVPEEKSGAWWRWLLAVGALVGVVATGVFLGSRLGNGAE